MKQITWDNSLSVQVDEIDEDHRRLIELFNILNRSVEEKAASDYIEAVLEELVSCTVWHFRHEERLMLTHGYQGLTEHRREHRELIESARDLQQKFQQQGKTLSGDDIAFLEHWVTGHIFGSDMEMGAFLCETME